MKKNDSNNLAIIGASGTGKTVLAVGLYATSTEEFTVSPIGDETSKYLEIRKTSIEEGFWPAATNESENFDLCLRLHAAGKQADIVFREYMGERMEKDPNYIRAVIGTPKSAMILFNPGMPGLAKPETRNRMIGNLKVIAQHLKENGCIAVAFVVTASDRLAPDSDLAAFKQDFESYAAEVTNHLTNLALDWRRFDVTVTEKLDDQNTPRLARGENNTTHKPFLWLLERIRNYERRKRIVSAVATAAILFGIAGATFGGLVLHSRYALACAEKALADRQNALNKAYDTADEVGVRTDSAYFKTNDFERIFTILPSDQARKEQLILRAREQSDLWSVRLLAMEFSSQSNKLANTPLNVPLDWFSKFDSDLVSSSPGFVDAIVERDKLKGEWNSARIELERGCQTAHFREAAVKESKNIRSVQPDALATPLKDALYLITNKDGRYGLVTNRSDLCIELLVDRTNAIARYAKSKADWDQTNDEPPADTEDLVQQTGRNLRSALSAAEFGAIETIIAGCRDAARIDWEQYQFPRRKDARLADLRAASDSPMFALKDSRVFLDEMDNLFPSIPSDERTEARTSITIERGTALGRYVDSQTNWTPDDEDPPGGVSDLVNGARKYLSDTLTKEELASLEESFNRKCSEARRAWESRQFPLRRKKQLDELKAASDSPTAALKDSRAFLDRMDDLFSSISEVDRSAARASITNERAAAINRYLDSLTNWKPEDDEPPASSAELQGKARKDLKSALSDAESENLSDMLAERCYKARRSWDAYHFPRRASELESSLKSAGANPFNALKGSLAFLGSMTNDFPTVSQADFIQTRTSIEQSRKAALAAYAASIASNWKVNDRKPPVFNESHLTKLTGGIVTEIEAKVFSSEIQSKFNSAKAQWNEEQKRLVDDFSVSGDPESMVREYAEFCDNWPYNPDRDRLCEKVDKSLQEYFLEFISNYEELIFGNEGKEGARLDDHPKQRMVDADLAFSKFVGVCRALNGPGNTNNAIFDKPSGKFAKLCYEKGSLFDVNRTIYSFFPQKLRITKIEVFVSLNQHASSCLGLDLSVGIGIDRWSYKMSEWEATDKFTFVNMKSKTDSRKSGNLPIASNGQWVTLWEGTKEFWVNPYTMTLIDCSFEDRLKARMSMDVEGGFLWSPYLDEDTNPVKYQVSLHHDSHDPTLGELQLRVTARRDGPDFWTLAAAAGLIK